MDRNSYRDAIKIALRKTPEISMDRRSVHKLSRHKRESSIEEESIEICRESYQAWRTGVFQGGKTHKDECNKQATQTKIQSTY